VVRRNQVPSATSSGITEVYQVMFHTHADIQDTGTALFWGGTDVDTSFSHWITMRWHGYLDQTYAVQRVLTLPDDTSRTETYRVRRMREIGGRKRFVLIEAEMEKVA